MKFAIEINNTRVLLTAEQANTLTNLLGGTEQVTNKYIGANAGTTSNYIKLIEPYSIAETLKFNALSDEEYGALVLVTKLQLASNP